MESYDRQCSEETRHIEEACNILALLELPRHIRMETVKLMVTFLYVSRLIITGCLGEILLFLLANIRWDFELQVNN